MLELRLSADVKRVAAMRDAIERECERTRAGGEHAGRVILVVEQLVGAPEARGRRGRRLRTLGDVFVIVTVQSDETMLIVRDTRPETDGLGERRRRVLEEHTSNWSTMSGRDGRTVWAEISRAPAVPAPRPDARPIRTVDFCEPAEHQAISPASSRRKRPPVATRA